MINVACVWSGNKYGFEYVERLRDMVARHLPRPHEFTCLTDHNDVTTGHIRFKYLDKLDLSGWWLKMALFHPVYRHGENNPTIYFDLDTVIFDDLTPLAMIACGGRKFTICSNFTRAKGLSAGRYGSCVMTFAADWGGWVYDEFRRDQARLMQLYGDQDAIERIIPNVGDRVEKRYAYLQEVLPDFFLHWRDFEPVRPPRAAVAIFAGERKPHNCQHEWLSREWR